MESDRTYRYLNKEDLANGDLEAINAKIDKILEERECFMEDGGCLNHEIIDYGNEVQQRLLDNLIQNWKSMPSGLEHCCLANFWERICAQVYKNQFSEEGDYSLVEKLDFELGEEWGAEQWKCPSACIENDDDLPTEVELEVFNAAKQAINELPKADAVILECRARLLNSKIALYELLEAIDNEAYHECQDPSETLDRYVNGNDIGALLAEAEESSEGAFEFLKRVVESEEFDDDTMVALLKLLNEGID